MAWHKSAITLDELNKLSVNTMGEVLGIVFTEIGDDYIRATMPVNKNTHQPYGLLHGGASAALAETIGSVASWITIDREKQLCVGIEINCNHIRGKKDGLVTATATPLHIGESTHVWDIRITDEKEKLVCVSRLTVAVIRNSAQKNSIR